MLPYEWLLEPEIVVAQCDIGRERLGIRGSDDPAEVEHHAVIGDGERAPRVLLHQDDGEPLLPAQPAHRVAAKHVVLACFHIVIPHIVPDLPQAQRQALAQNVKTPLVYTNVLVRNWEAWIRLKVHAISAPMSFHSGVALDFPVSLGGYQHPREPSEPMLLHLVHVPGAPNSGLDARTQFRLGAAKLLDMTFSDFEKKIRGELDRMLGPGGFSSAGD